MHAIVEPARPASRGDLPAQRILVVDADAGQRKGLASALVMRGAGDVLEAGTADEAEAELQRAPFDLVFADAKAAVRSERPLFERLQERWPATTRVALCNHTDRIAMRQSFVLAHRVLPQPCDAAAAVDTAQRAAHLSATFANSRLQKIVGGVGALPPAPNLFLSMTAALRRSKASLEDIARIVETDPAIATRTLKLVNSPTFRLRRNIVSISEAVVLLGAERLRMLVLAAEVSRASGVSGEEQQKHAIEVAELAAAIAGSNRSSAAFTAGLVHDIGRLVLAQRYSQELRQLSRNGTPGHVRERQVWGFDHALVGGYLLGQWGLPLLLIDAVTHHHAPGSSESSTLGLALVVHIADAIVHERHGDAEDRLDEQLLTERGLLDRLSEWRAIGQGRAR